MSTYNYRVLLGANGACIDLRGKHNNVVSNFGSLSSKEGEFLHLDTGTVIITCTTEC